MTDHLVVDLIFLLPSLSSLFLYYHLSVCLLLLTCCTSWISNKPVTIMPATVSSTTLPPHSLSAGRLLDENVYFNGIDVMRTQHYFQRTSKSMWSGNPKIGKMSTLIVTPVYYWLRRLFEITRAPCCCLRRKQLPGVLSGDDGEKSMCCPICRERIDVNSGY